MEQVVQGIVDAPALALFKTRLDGTTERPGLLGGITAHGSLGGYFKVPSSLDYFMILFSVAKATE